MKSKVIDRILNSITKEDMKNWRQEKIDSRDKMNIDEMLGYYVGEEICRRHLPRLQTDGFRNYIKISDEEMETYTKLSDIHSEKYLKEGPDKSNKEWVEYRTFAKDLEEKYLPNPLFCRLNHFNVNAIDDIEISFKNGLIDSLWNDDFCHYSLKHENIKVYNCEDSGDGIIELIYVREEI